jgi:cytochrome P450
LRRSWRRSRIWNSTAKLIALKREQPADELITELVRIADDGGQLTDKQIVSNLLLILIAALDATLKQLSNSLVALLSRPDEYARLCRHPDMVANAVEELMRYLLLAPTGLPIRIATEDVELGGQPIRAGEAVIAAHPMLAKLVAGDLLDLNSIVGRSKTLASRRWSNTARKSRS